MMLAECAIFDNYYYLNLIFFFTFSESDNSYYLAILLGSY